MKFALPDVFECCASECSFGKLKMFFLCIYRPDTPPLAYVDLYLEKLMEILRILSDENYDAFVIMGVFNYDFFRMNIGKTSEFVIVIGSFELDILVSGLTKVKISYCVK